MRYGKLINHLLAQISNIVENKGRYISPSRHQGRYILIDLMNILIAE